MRTIEEMKSVKVDIRKLYTQSAYAKLIGKTRARVNQMVKAKELKTVDITGATLIIVD